MRHRYLIAAVVIVLQVACTAPGAVQSIAAPVRSTLIGVGAAQLTPDFWVSRLQQPDALLLDDAAIAAQNGRLFRVDASMHDLGALPGQLSRQQVRDWIEGLSQRPQRPRFDRDGKPLSTGDVDALVGTLDLDAIPASQPTRYGLVVHRAALRTFPTTLRVFSTPGDHDIDRFQETALFPGTPVAIVHESRDRAWWFVVSPNYAAWIEKRHVAEGSRQAVMGYTDRRAYRLVTAAKASTAFTPDEPRVSELQLDMGVRAPLAALPADAPVNGQHPYTAWTVELPVREPDGSLAFAPALLPRNADTAGAPLALTRANLIRQSFKFLGERYGWGHDYNGRDCSGFVGEVYRSMGVAMPRNTGDQASSPAFDTTVFAADASDPSRKAAVDGLQVGDLVFVPGHVMLVIGRIDDAVHVIHDINGGSVLDASGNLKSLHLNGVSVTPLAPLRFDAETTYIDRMTHIVRMRR